MNRPRVQGRLRRFMERLAFTDLGLDPRGFYDPASERILIRRKDFIFFPAWIGKTKCLLIGQILCFENHYFNKGGNHSQQLFQGKSEDDFVWLRAFEVQDGVLFPTAMLFQKIQVKLVNNQVNQADVRNYRLHGCSQEEFLSLKEELWKPMDKIASENQTTLEEEKSRRLRNGTYPTSYMNYEETWAEIRVRLDVEEKADVYDALKALERRLCLDLGLIEITGPLILSRLKAILKLLRVNKVMLGEMEVGDGEDEDDAGSLTDVASQANN